MFEKPLVTIVTPSFNQGQFIERTILSVLNQTYDKIQYILVDGASDDNSVEVINKYSDKIDIVIIEKDGGQSEAINKGFRLADGELVGWLNSDDLLYPDCVEKIVELYLKNKNGSIFYCSKFDYIDSNDNLIKIGNVNILSRNILLNHNYNLVQPGSFYKNELLKKVDFLNEDIFYCMDLDLWLRLLEHGLIYQYSNKSLSAFRVWQGTKTSNGGELFLKNISEVLKKNGGSMYSKNNLRIRYYSFKLILKRFLKPLFFLN